MSKERVIAIAGNPNSGKTSFFNLLTGNNATVGNWPGVTVEYTSAIKKEKGSIFKLIDLPGCYSLSPDSEDQKCAADYIESKEAHVCFNIVDSVNLSRNLFLTMELIQQQSCPTILFLNMLDLAKKQNIHIDIKALEKLLGIPVIPVISISKKSVNAAFSKAFTMIQKGIKLSKIPIKEGIDEKYKQIDEICSSAIKDKEAKKSVTEQIDKIVLHPLLSLPIFLASMYLVFWFAVNLGGIFIDFFDITTGAIFVDGLGHFLESIGIWEWLTVLISNGMGAGLQTVATFIPVIFFMFLMMAILEDSGYFTRAAYMADRLMRKIGLPGNAFVPLLLGFGCTVPAIMGVKTLRNREDRLKTIFMAPFMSCGARLPVYALFCAALYGKWSGLIVFSIYIFGVVFAILTGLLLKKTVYSGAHTEFILEMPEYHFPKILNVLKTTWIRLKAFLKKATLIIVFAVTILGFINSIGISKERKISFGNEDSTDSVLTIVGKAITPIFIPMGIDKDNWPATVSLFTGLFAKEAIVGTINSLYSQTATFNDEPKQSVDDSKISLKWLATTFGEAFLSIRDNFIGIFTSADLIGVSIVSENEETISQELEADTSVFVMLRKNFTGFQAYSYLLFVLIYFPCIAVLGAIYRRAGFKFTLAVTAYCSVLAYAIAMLFYQVTEGHQLKFILLAIVLLAIIVSAFKVVSIIQSKIKIRGKQPQKQETTK